jgi:hypothetical protein
MVFPLTDSSVGLRCVEPLAPRRLQRLSVRGPMSCVLASFAKARFREDPIRISIVEFCALRYREYRTCLTTTPSDRSECFAERYAYRTCDSFA